MSFLMSGPEGVDSFSTVIDYGDMRPELPLPEKRQQVIPSDALGDAEPIAVRQLRRLPNAGHLRAVATVEIGLWTIRGCRIIQQGGRS